jgi:hypothetical protein
MPRRSPALAAALAVAVAAAPAMAQPRSSNRPPQDVANDLVKQAITKSQQGDHLGAIKLYLDAYSLIPQHTLLSNVGAEFQAADKKVEALRYFCMYLEKDPTGTSATYASSMAKALQIELGNKDFDEQAPCKPAAPPPPPPPPKDEVLETKDLHGTGHSAGGSAGGTLKLTGVVTGLIGLAGIAAGSYYGLKAQDRTDQLSNHDIADPWPDNIRQIEAEGQKFENRQILLTIAGGVLTATGAVLFIVGATRTSSTEHVTIRPTATSNSVGIALGRGF